MNRIPTASDIEQAHERIKPYIHRTPVMTSSSLDDLAACQLYFKCENFQKVGAFKARAQLATEALGGKTYRIVNLSLNNNGYPRPYARGPMVMKASAASADVTPDIEPGTSEVSINADGVIEVQMP